jgi:hypothetical protein
MPPHNTKRNAWYEDTVQEETHIDPSHDGAAWINNAKARTHSIISSLDTQAATAPQTADNEAPAQLQNFYDPETFSARFGLESPKHTTPRITEGQQSACDICTCCQLPRAPSSFANGLIPSTSIGLPPSPLLQHKLADSACQCFCPDTKMPQERLEPPPSIKPHIRRRSSLSVEGATERKLERERAARREMSVGSWL